MNDNDIIKALECCTKRTVFRNCEQRHCPAIKECGKGFMFVEKQALALINRQKAEIDGLQQLVNLSIDTQNEMTDTILNFEELLAEKNAEIERLQKAIDVLDIMEEQHKYYLEKAKAEAIREFIRKFDEKVFPLGLIDNNYAINAKAIKVACEKIEKELVGDAE